MGAALGFAVFTANTGALITEVVAPRSVEAVPLQRAEFQP